MIDKKKIADNLKFIEEMTQHGASPPLDEYWNPIVNMLSEDIEETKKYLSNCDVHDLWLMSVYFEDISYNFQSREFVDFLKELAKSHPEADMDLEIEYAEKAIQD